MQRENVLHLALELGVLLFIVLACLGLLFPIWSVTNNYPFYLTNVIFIAVFVMGMRLLFGLNYSFLAKRQEWKIGMMLAMVPLLFFLISSLTGFMAEVEESSFDSITGHLPEPDRESSNNYIWREMILTGVGAILCCFLLPIRLFISIWQQRNKTGKKQNVFQDEDEY
jgi:hypothetical protein